MDRKAWKREAFTTIELVFIIVIIGILAAIAIPRLAATRDDAKMTIIAHNLMAGATEIAAYATVKGRTQDSLEQMSNAIKSLIDRGWIQTISGQPEINVEWGGIDDCVVMKIVDQGANTEILSIETNGTTSSGECDRLRSLIDTSQYPMPLRGHMISISN